MSDLRERAKKVIIEQLGVEEELVIPEADLDYDLGTDSLDMVILVMELEAEFGIEILDEKMEKVKTVGDLYRLLESLVK